VSAGFAVDLQNYLGTHVEGKSKPFFSEYHHLVAVTHRNIIGGSSELYPYLLTIYILWRTIIGGDCAEKAPPDSLLDDGGNAGLGYP